MARLDKFRRDLNRMKEGDTLSHPTVPGLRFRARKAGVFAEYRFKEKATGQWRSRPLGKLGEPVSLDALAPSPTGPQPGTLHITLPDPVEAMEEAAREARDMLAAGLDPRHKAPGAPWEAITLREALDLHLASKTRSPRTETDYVYLPKKYLPDGWLDRPLATFTRPEVYAAHRRIGAQHPYAANHVFRIFSAAWNRARRQHPELPDSPTQNVDWFPEERRDRAIPLASLPQWYREVMALTNTVRRDYYLLGVFTGLRRTPLARCDWRTWTLRTPPSTSPSRRRLQARLHPTPERLACGPDPRPDRRQRRGRPKGGAQPFRMALSRVQ